MDTFKRFLDAGIPARRTAVTVPRIEGVRRLLRAAAALPGTWMRRVRQRRELAAMDPRMLRDIGVDRVEARREARKPFWLD